MLVLHLIALACTAVVVLVADEQALAWVRGKKEVLDARLTHRLHVLTWVGLGVLTVSGVFLFWPMRAYLLETPLFVIKLLFVGILLTNAVLIGRLMPVALTNKFAELSWDERTPLLVSGALSVIGWLGTACIAFVVFGF